MKPIKGKKAMEMWVLVLMVLSIILLLAVIVWYSGLGTALKGLLDKLSSRLGGIF